MRSSFVVVDNGGDYVFSSIAVYKEISAVTEKTVLPKLTPQYIYQHTSVSANEIGKNETLEKIKNAELEMQVILGMAQIEVSDIIDLKVDDVIKLDQKLNKELVACINNKKKFYVVPGALQNKVCVKIMQQYQEKE